VYTINKFDGNITGCNLLLIETLKYANINLTL